MRRLILSAICLPFFTIANIQWSQAFECSSANSKKTSQCNENLIPEEGPNFCNKKNLTASQRENCLLHEEKLLLQYSRKPPQYPVSFFSAKTHYDPLTGKELNVFWSAEDKSHIKIKHLQDKQEPRLIYSIPSKRIISYKQVLIDMSDNAGEEAIKFEGYNEENVFITGSPQFDKYFQENTKISKDDLAIKRPGSGIYPKYIESVVGKSLKLDVEYDHILNWSDIE